MSATIYVEAQYAPAAGVIRLQARAEGTRDAYRVTNAVADGVEAVAAANQFVRMYREMGARVITDAHRGSMAS